MALVIEDGTIVANATSYVTVDECKAYAATRGLALPSTDPAIEVLLVLACDFLQALEPRFKGARVDTNQELAWPRQLVFVYDYPEPLPSITIPKILKQAQCQLACDAKQYDLLPTGEGRQVIMKQVDVLVTQWSDTKASTIQPVFTKAMGILQPLLRSTAVLSTIRV